MKCPVPEDVSNYLPDVKAADEKYVFLTVYWVGLSGFSRAGAGENSTRYILLRCGQHLQPFYTFTPCLRIITAQEPANPSSHAPPTSISYTLPNFPL
jgi:hypothetical protein